MTPLWFCSLYIWPIPGKIMDSTNATRGLLWITAAPQCAHTLAFASILLPQLWHFLIFGLILYPQKEQKSSFTVFCLQFGQIFMPVGFPQSGQNSSIFNSAPQWLHFVVALISLSLLFSFKNEAPQFLQNLANDFCWAALGTDFHIPIVEMFIHIGLWIIIFTVK